MTIQAKKIEEIFLETMGKTADKFGISRIVAQLYALLYLSPNPLSLDEMVERLNVSKGNVSVNIRILDSWQAVRKIWKKGSRKDYYTAELDIKKIVANKLKDGLNRTTSEIMSQIEKIEKVLDEETKNDLSLSQEDRKTFQSYRERIGKIKDLNSSVNGIIALIKNFI